MLITTYILIEYIKDRFNLNMYFRVIINLIVVILFIIIHIIYFTQPLLCESFVDAMQNGNIARTTLPLGPGQTIRDLNPGSFPVTGGLVKLGYLGNGEVLRVIGITIDNLPQTAAGWQYQVGNQPFNANFAKVLFELRAAGHGKISYSFLDYHIAGVGRPALISDYFKQFKSVQGLNVNNDYGETTISSKILNALAEQI